MTLLSRLAILRHMQAGNIRIDPFNPENLGTASYDVTLGEFYYREAPVRGPGPSQEVSIYNPFDPKQVEKVWKGPYQAGVKDTQLANIPSNARVIIVRPGETILAHTQEYIGGVNCVNTMMKTRSSWGRNFIAVCKCAGWGDVGFTNRWTLEITNFSSYHAIPLVVGWRIAQVVFEECEDISGPDYLKGGKYQKYAQEWTPGDMLPKLYLDREVVGAASPV